MKEKDIKKLKEEVELNRRHYEKNLSDMRNTSDKSKMASSRMNCRSVEDENKRKVR